MIPKNSLKLTLRPELDGNRMLQNLKEIKQEQGIIIKVKQYEGNKNK